MPHRKLFQLNVGLTECNDMFLDTGTIRLMGLQVDSMSFVCIIISVGLVVDYLMHVLLVSFPLARSGHDRYGSLNCA
jgi:hypothetical protein